MELWPWVENFIALWTAVGAIVGIVVGSSLTARLQRRASKDARQADALGSQEAKREIAHLAVLDAFQDFRFALGQFRQQQASLSRSSASALTELMSKSIDTSDRALLRCQAHGHPDVTAAVIEAVQAIEATRREWGGSARSESVQILIAKVTDHCVSLQVATANHMRSELERAATTT